jgi:4-hydroxybenzoate polyprenyltransferase
MFPVALDLKGFAQFISAERGLMLFMISVGATFLTIGSTAWLQAIYLGSTVFFLWSGLDALNNVFDADLDIISDPSRAKYTKTLGKNGLLAAIAFSVLSLGLGAITMVPLVVLFILIGVFFGVLYSVPPFRLRQTLYKPLVNITVGAIPVLIVASFSNTFSVSVATLVLLIGITTAVNSLWEDLGDYASDYASGARTVPVIAGFKKGLLFTIIMGYCLIPLMVVVGILFQLNLIYYFILSGLTTFVSLRLYQNRTILFREACASDTDTEKLYELGHVLAKDFVIVAIIQTLGLMISSYL